MTMRPRALGLFVLMCLWTATAAVAAQTPEPPPDAARLGLQAAIETAPVRLDGQVLFSLRGISAFPAGDRAAAVEARLETVARDRTFDPQKLAVVEEETMSALMAGKLRLVSFVDADGELEGVSRQSLAGFTCNRIRQAIIKYRADRQPEAIQDDVLTALLYTGILAVALLLLAWVWRRIMRRLATRIEERVRSLGVDSLKSGSAQRVGSIIRRGLRSVFTLIILVAVYLYAHSVLGLLPWTRSIHAKLGVWVIQPLQIMGNSVVNQLPNLIFLLILFFVLRWVLGLVRLFFDSVAKGTITFANFDPEWAHPTYKIVRLLIVAFGLVVAYPYIPGSESAAFKGISLFLGVVFSLGSSSVISNLLAGFTLTYRKAFKLGDRVKIGEVVGDVTTMRLQVTHLRTPKNEEVIIPNSSILNGDVTNYSSMAQSPGLILHTTVGIGYETPWRQVEAMLLQAADRTPDLLKTPPPFVLLNSLGDFCVVYEINAFCDQPQQMGPLYARLHRSILDVFNEYGVQIMTPAYEGDPDQPKVVPRDEWYKSPAEPPRE
ncbi:MAG TPA: mechanosensitive ion channel family protein [Acidobacteriota bacterium]|nr:mechanosensitive ion channel family protein [Acidobacteriota bacterium]HQM62852.1 mechanosensitive ion channel family protein [Acidobacteriota bacterium]